MDGPGRVLGSGDVVTPGRKAVKTVTPSKRKPEKVCECLPIFRLSYGGPRFQAKQETTGRMMTSTDQAMNLLMTTMNGKL